MKQSDKDKGLYRINVGIEDAVRFESLLANEGIRFESYMETLGNVVKVFVLDKSDFGRIESIVTNHEIATGQVHDNMFTSRTVKLTKLMYGSMIAVGVLTIIVLTLSKLLK